MLGKELVDMANHPVVRQATSDSSANLSQIISAMTPEADAATISLAAWSLVHGYTPLCIETGLEKPEQRKARARLFAHTVEALARSDSDEPNAARCARDTPLST